MCWALFSGVTRELVPVVLTHPMRGGAIHISIPRIGKLLRGLETCPKTCGQEIAEAEFGPKESSSP